MSALRWAAANLDLVRERLWEHLTLTALAVLIGVAITAPLTLAVRRLPWLRTPLLTLTGALYTVPALALFVLLIPLTGLSRSTAVTGLVLYSLLVLLRNALVGLEGVPEEVRDAALAAGHTPRELLLRVELPLALPVLMAGLRLATVSTIGLVTITALIGYGGLGRLLYLGFSRRNNGMLLTGLVLTVAVAVLADLALARLERRLAPWAREPRADTWTPGRPA